MEILLFIDLVIVIKPSSPILLLIFIKSYIVSSSQFTKNYPTSKKVKLFHLSSNYLIFINYD